jgi:hypothetical protein
MREVVAPDAYQAFLARKRIIDIPTGMSDVAGLPEFLFPHQRDIVRWALRRGRAAIFAGTGLGKSNMELEWSRQVAAYTDKPVLIFAPLAVSNQHLREAEKFGFQAAIVKSQSDVRDGISITNYQKLQHFDLSQFGGICIDESSILKSTDGHYRTKLIEECARVPFRLAATATPAPNDFMELGNHAEFLGVMSYTDMLATFFTHDGGETQKWRLKGHAESEFWRWMASWSVMLRKPSDLGYDDAGYDLPPLRQIQHTCSVPYAPNINTGLLFPMEAIGLGERIAARRASIEDRVNLTSSLVTNDDRWLIWCNLNGEQDALEKALAGRCISIRGANTDEENTRRILSWLDGERPILIGKPSMIGFGLNFQCCNQMIFNGLNDSFEQVYQAIRRCWRFGQVKPVTAHFIAAETEGAVVANLRRKEADADRMAAAMVEHMADLSAENIRGMVRDRPDYDPHQPMQIPEWIAA